MHTPAAPRAGSWRRHRKALLVLGTLLLYFLVWIFHAIVAVSHHEAEHDSPRGGGGGVFDSNDQNDVNGDPLGLALDRPPDRLMTLPPMQLRHGDTAKDNTVPRKAHQDPLRPHVREDADPDAQAGLDSVTAGIVDHTAAPRVEVDDEGPQEMRGRRHRRHGEARGEPPQDAVVGKLHASAGGVAEEARNDQSSGAGGAAGGARRRRRRHKERHSGGDGGAAPVGSGGDGDGAAATQKRRRHHHRRRVADSVAADEPKSPAPDTEQRTRDTHRRETDDVADNQPLPMQQPTHAPDSDSDSDSDAPIPAHGGRHHRRRHRRAAAAEDDGAPIEVDDVVAFSVVVSNEDFIDGALTLAWSFQNHSALFQTRKAHLVAIVAEGSISDGSIARLQRAGWTETLVLPDLTKEAPKAHWAPTFNKLYLFNLTRYARVAYFDVDMLMLRNPDVIFKTKLPDARHIGALGNNPKSHKPYFQSGMMLIAPSAEAFDWMMNEFRTNPYHRTLNGRDGAIIRKYYEDRYVLLDDALSAHLGVHEPLDTVIGFHFRGQWKPWFDREKPPTEPDRFAVTKKPQPLQEMGEAYRLWWHCYEDMHRRVFMNLEAQTRSYNPKLQVWLMRNTPHSYVQFLSDVDVARRNLTFPRLTLEKSLAGESCDFVCAVRQGVCSERALQFSEVNKCERLQEYYGCRTCTIDHPGADQPGYDVGSKKCLVNPLHYKTMRPNCTAKHPHTRRLCPCVPIDAIHDAPLAFGKTYQLPATKDAHKYDPGLTVDAKARHRASGCFPSHSDYYNAGGDAPCIRYLSDVSNVAFVTPLGTTLWAGRTAKLLFHYKELNVRAIVKFPQKSFPHEAHSEVVAHAVDREAHFHRVPPTAFAFVPRALLAAGFANLTTDEHTAAANAQFVQGEVWDVVDGMPALSRNGDASGDAGPTIGVSIQLWVHDVHRLAESSLKVPKQYARWFEKNPAEEVPAVEQYPQHARAMFELSRLVSFDYIIGNDDRSPFKNCYVVGACEKFCQRSTHALHDGAPQFVFLDQGRSLYYAGDPAGNPLSAPGAVPGGSPIEAMVAAARDGASEGESGASAGAGAGAGDGRVSGASAFCKFPKAMYLRLRALAEASDEDEKGEAVVAAGSSGGGEAGGGAETAQPPSPPHLLLAKLVSDRLSPEVIAVVGEQQLGNMQRRLERLVAHIRGCVAAHGEEFVFSLN